MYVTEGIEYVIYLRTVIKWTNGGLVVVVVVVVVVVRSCKLSQVYPERLVQKYVLMDIMSI